jgi:hypothetical protein
LLYCASRFWGIFGDCPASTVLGNRTSLTCYSPHRRCRQIRRRLVTSSLLILLAVVRQLPFSSFLCRWWLASSSKRVSPPPSSSKQVSPPLGPKQMLAMAVAAHQVCRHRRFHGIQALLPHQAVRRPPRDVLRDAPPPPVLTSMTFALAALAR